MSRIDAAMLLGVYAGVTVSILIGLLGFLAVGQTLQHVGIRVVALAIAAGFTAGSREAEATSFAVRPIIVPG